MQYNFCSPDFDVRSPNFWLGRYGQKPKAIVLHKPEGNLFGVLSEMQKKSFGKSYHYVISKTGAIYCLVDPENSAWACGVQYRPTWKGIVAGYNPNTYTVNISLAGFATDPTPALQTTACMRLCADICDQFGIAPADDTIIYHREIDTAKACPGANVDKEEIIVAVKSMIGNNVKLT